MNKIRDLIQGTFLMLDLLLNLRNWAQDLNFIICFSSLKIETTSPSPPKKKKTTWVIDLYRTSVLHYRFLLKGCRPWDKDRYKWSVSIERADLRSRKATFVEERRFISEALTVTSNQDVAQWNHSMDSVFCFTSKFVSSSNNKIN